MPHVPLICIHPRIETTGNAVILFVFACYRYVHEILGIPQLAPWEFQSLSCRGGDVLWSRPLQLHPALLEGVKREQLSILVAKCCQAHLYVLSWRAGPHVLWRSVVTRLGNNFSPLTSLLKRASPCSLWVINQVCNHLLSSPTPPRAVRTQSKTNKRWSENRRDSTAPLMFHLLIPLYAHKS